MSDLAVLGMRFDTEGAEAAERHLDTIAEKSGRTEKATDALSGGFRRAGTATGQMDEELIKAVRSHEDALRHAKNLGGALGNLAGDAATGGASLDSLATNGTRAATSLFGLGARAIAVTSVIGVLAGTAGVAAAAWLDAEKSSLALDRAASGLGRTAGLTGEQLQKLAIAAAEQGNVSVRSAEQQAAAYISTGRIGGEMISRLIADGKDLASFLGKDLPAATSYLATSMGDPSKAAVEMTRQFGLLTQAQIEEIKKAQDAGEAYRAQKILMDALSGAAEGHADKVGVMTSAWEALAKAAQDAWSWMGRALYQEDSEKLAGLDAAVAREQRKVFGGDKVLIADLRAQARDLEARLGAREVERNYSAAQFSANQAAQARADAAKPTGTTRGGTRSGGATPTDRDQANLIRQSQQLIEQMNREAEVYGLTWEQLALYNAEKQIAALATNGFTQQETLLAASIRESTAAMIAHRKAVDGEKLDALPKIDLRPLDIPVIKFADELRNAADELRLIDQLARDAGYGIAESFGAPGAALAGMMTAMSGYQSRLADIKLAVQDKRLTETQGAREAATAQIQSYGDMAAAAKGFFAEGSDGYRVLQAAEQGYRLFQFAMAVQAMALNASETGSVLATSGIKAGAYLAEGAAKMFAMLGPFAFPAVAAMVAVLASLGLKGKGGSGGGYSPANDNVDASVSTVQGYAAADERARDSAAQAVASRVEVVVTADRNGMNAFVVGTAQREAASVAIPMAASAAGYAKQDTLKELNNRQAGNRKVVT